VGVAQVKLFVDWFMDWSFGLLVWAGIIVLIDILWPWTWTGKEKDRNGGN